MTKKGIFDGAAFRIALIAAVLGVAALSPAPINDPRAATAPQAERTQDVVQREQETYQGVQREMAPPVADTEVEHADSITTDADAKDAMAAASQGSDRENPSQTLSKADKSLKEGKPAGGTSWWLGLVFLALGFGVVAAFRQYANKAVPEMPASPGKKANW